MTSEPTATKRIIKSRGRPALTSKERQKRYLADPEKLAKHRARSALCYQRRKERKIAELAELAKVR